MPVIITLYKRITSKNKVMIITFSRKNYRKILVDDKKVLPLHPQTKTKSSLRK